MTKKELKEALLMAVYNELIRYNFKLNKNLCEFTRKDKEGWEKFQLIFLTRDDGWEINLGMLIRKNRVEDLFHKASYFDPKYHKTTPTIGITVENFINDGKEHRFNLNSENDLANCYEKINEIFREIALPFFKRFDTIESIEEAINLKEGNSIFSGIKYEGNVGIILAKLVKNPDFDFFKEKYIKYYSENYNGFYLKEYKDILKVLEAI